MSDKKTSEILEDAGDVLEKNGWTQGSFTSMDGEVCAMGAVAKAKYGFARDTRVFDRPEDMALRAYLGVEWVPEWNDEPGRTKEQVLDALRGAAKQERLREEGIL